MGGEEQLGKLPELFDWRSYNAVTPVKNQGKILNFKKASVIKA